MRGRILSTLKTKRPVWLIIAGFIVILSLAYLLQKAGVLGPTRGGQFPNRVILWKISDHTTGNTPLVNDINGTDAPEYANESVVVPLRRASDGSIENLLRFQGEFEYRSN